MSNIALVAGGTSGIGLATARQLAARGATVHIVGRGKQRLDEIAATDPGLIGHQADGGDRAEIGAVAEAIGRIDWLVLSLSGNKGLGPIADLDLDTLRQGFEAKFFAHLTAIQAALPHLAPDGSITLLSAITARAAVPGTAGIGAINAAVEALVKPLAVELAPIRVNAVSPGGVDTPWWDWMPAADRQAYFEQSAARLPVRRIAAAEDIAEAVVLAATNRNLTGTVLESDGGYHLVSP